MVGAGVPVNKVFALKDMPAIGIPVGTPERVTVGATVTGAGGGVGAGAGATYAAAIEIAIVSDAVTPFAPVTVIVIVEVPAAVGVPLTSPVVESILRPAGKVPFVTANVFGEVPPVEVGVIE